MDYHYEVTCLASADEALRIIRDALIANGFGIEAREEFQFTARGPGMLSSRENAIRGVTKARVTSSRGRIEIQAELGGVARLRRFVTLFPIALGMLLATTFLLIVWATGELGKRPVNVWIPLVAPLLSTLPWLILGPWMARLFRRRTERAIELLLQSAANNASASD